MSNPFQNPDAWAGGTFDVLMFFGTTSLDRTIDIARELWCFERLDGPYRHRHLLPTEQDIVNPDFTEDGCEQLVGVYRHQDGESSPFVHTTIRGDDGLWVYAGIPMGGFPERWNVGAYPFDDGKSVDWVLDITSDLRLLAYHIRERYPMLAIAYGWFDVSILDTIDDAMRGIVHEDRWHEIELATSQGWMTFPITKLEPLFRNAG
jgi:hypothetical protein